MPVFAVGLINPGADVGFTTYFLTSTPAFSSDVPTPSIFGAAMLSNYDPPYTFALDGGVGNLVVNDLGSAPFTAEITAAVPEPGQWAMMGLTFCGVAGYGYRRFRANKAA